MTIRFGGMASGLDTESIISAMLSAKKVPIEALEKKVSQQEELYGVWTATDVSVSMLKVSTNQLTSYTTWQQKSFSSTNKDVISGTVNNTLIEPRNYAVNVINLARAHQYHSDAQASAKEPLGWSGVFRVNGQEITVVETDSLEGISHRINTASGDMDGAKARSYIIGTTMVLESQKTGIGNEITIEYVSGDDILGNLGVDKPENEIAALNLNATIDNISVSSTENTGVTSFISGLSLNFLDTGSSNISVKRDLESIKDKINDFITSYNETMAYLKEQTQATIGGSKTVSETGLLQGDMLANNIQNRARNILASVNKDPNQMNQQFNSLFTIGIWTTSEENKFEIVDEEKLNNALENNFEEVMNLFRSFGNEGEGQGVFRRMENYLNALTNPADGAVILRGNTLKSQIEYNNNQLQKMNVDLISYEVELWAHFARMETMINSIQSQGNYVFASLGIQDQKK